MSKSSAAQRIVLIQKSLDRRMPVSARSKVLDTQRQLWEQHFEGRSFEQIAQRV